MVRIPACRDFVAHKVVRPHCSLHCRLPNSFTNLKLPLKLPYQVTLSSLQFAKQHDRRDDGKFGDSNSEIAEDRDIEPSKRGFETL